MKRFYQHNYSWTLLCVLLLSTFSCKKNGVLPTDETTQLEPIEARTTGGLIPDDPSRVATVDVVISSSFKNSWLLSARTIKSGGSKGPDGIAPNITVLNPVNGSTVTGVVNITVNATDNVGVSSVSYLVDGVALGSSSTAPFTFAWNTSSLATGVHTLEAKAKDAAGNWTSSSITISKNTEVLYNLASSPARFSVATPVVGVQGFEASCVAFAAGYAARSIEEYYKKSGTSFGYATNLFSPEFIFNQTKGGADCKTGSSFTTVLDFMKNKGVCTWQSMPYNYSNGCSLMPTAAQTSEALNYKITSYSATYTNDIIAIKSLLLSKHPVVVGVYPDNSFSNATADFVWRGYSGTRGGGHALAIVGYDDAKNAFMVMNSWGTSWGSNGYSWIDYQFLAQCAVGSYCYSITL